jgi:hypothetical protein
MTYHLCLKDEECPRARYLEPGDAEVTALCAALGSWVYGAHSPSSPYLITYLLDHDYSPANLQFHMLKGDDLMRANVLRSIAAQLDIKLYVTLVHRYISCEDRTEKDPPDDCQWYALGGIMGARRIVCLLSYGKRDLCIR